MSKDQLMFGAAYYPEYMPCERMEKDFQMMKKAGINTIRVAESTLSRETGNLIFPLSTGYWMRRRRRKCP